MVAEEPIADGARRLSLFVGQWDVSGCLRDGTEALAVTGHWTFNTVGDGWGVSGDLHTSIEGSGSFDERELIGFDAAGGQIHMFSVNRFTIRDHIGAWSDEKTLVTVYENQGDEGLTTEEITVRFPTPTRMTALVIEKLDGRTVATTELDLERTSN